MPSVFQSGTSCTALNRDSQEGTSSQRQRKSFSALRALLPVRLFEYPRAGFFNEVAPVVPTEFAFAGRMNYFGLTNIFVGVIS